MFATVDHMQSDNQESFVNVSYYRVNDGWTVDKSGQTVDKPKLWPNRYIHVHSLQIIIRLKSISSLVIIKKCQRCLI